MDFALSKQQRDIQKAAREFAAGEFDRELALELEASHAFPTQVWKRACEEGFVGLLFPEEYGGTGFGVLENSLVIEEFCRRDSGIGAAIMSADFASECVLRFGNDEQKQRFLTPVASGEYLSGGAITEPEHGSDITSMDTTAVRDGDEWVINGVKTFITNAGLAGYYVVICTTDREAGHRGLSMIVVEASRPGIEIASVGEKMGLRMIPTGQLSLSNVRVPRDNLLGQEGRGFHQILAFFDESRIEVAAQGVGTAQGAFDRALAYVKGREQFGRRIADFQANQHKLADMATKIELARLITYKASWQVDTGQLDPKLSSMAKLYAARAAVEVCDEAIQLLGGYGYVTEFEVERYYRDARIIDIYEGTREIQKNTIAGALVGKRK